MKDLLTPRTPLSQEELDRAVGQQGTEFGKGMRSSTLSMRQGMSNAMGAVGDAAGYSDFAQDQYQQADALGLRAQNSAPRVTSFRDINRVGDAVDWGMGVAGGLLPSAAVGVGAGLMTGGAAVPAMLAGTAAYAPFEVGEVVGRQREAGQPVSLRDAGISGLGSAALQSIVPAGLAGKAMGQVAKVPGRTLKGAVLRDGLTEGVAETGGEFAKQLGSTQTLDTLDTGAGLDAFAGGVLGGGLMGGAGHVVQHGPAGVKALGQGLDTAKNAATGLLGRAKGAAKAAGESDLGQKAVGAAEGLVDLGEKAVAGAKDLGAAAQKTYEGYEIPKKLSEVWDKVRGGTERTLEQIANSDNVIGDTAKFATAQKDKLTGMFTENDNQRIEAVKQAAADLIKEKLTPDQQQALQTFAADVSDRTSQAKVASIKLAKTGAKAAVSALQRFTQLVSEKRAQLKTGDSKVKKSEDYSALEDGIMQELAPALFEARPDLATEVDEDTMRGAARALRLTIRDLAAGDRPSTAALTALLDAVGPEHVTNVLKAAERAIGTTDKKETDRIFKGLLMVDDLMAEKATLLKTLRASLKPGLPYRVTDEMLRNDADGLAAWQDHYKANSNDPKSQLLDREMRAALAKRYGDKADVVLEMAAAHKYTEDNILAGVMGEDEARPGREAENVIETDAPETGIRKKGVSDQEDFVATKSNDEYGLYPKPGAPTKARDGKTYPHRTVAAIERMKGRHGDMPVRWVSAEELGWDHPEIKAVLDKKVELLLDDSSDLTRAEAEEMARRSMKDKGLVVAEGSRQETRISDAELDSIRWETKFDATPAQLRLPGPGGKGKVLIDAVKLTDLMRKRLHKGDDNWLPGEAKRPLARKARMFKEGIAALQVHLGYSFDIPDATVIDKTGTTWGAVKNEKLPIKDTDGRYDPADFEPSTELIAQWTKTKQQLKEAMEIGDQKRINRLSGRVAYLAEAIPKAVEREHANIFDERQQISEGNQQRDPFGNIHRATVGEYNDGTDEVKSEIKTNLTGLPRSEDPIKPLSKAAPTELTMQWAKWVGESLRLPTLQETKDSLKGLDREQLTNVRDMLDNLLKREKLPAGITPLRLKQYSASVDEALRNTPAPRPVAQPALGQDRAAVRRGEGTAMGEGRLTDTDTTAPQKGFEGNEWATPPGQAADTLEIDNALETMVPTGPRPPVSKGPGAGATKGPRAVAAKKAALQKAASSGDPALLKELAASNDAKGLQRAVQTLVEGKSDANTDAAIDAANKRLGELVSGSEHVAYGMGIKKYSLMRTGDAANDDSPVLRFPDRKGERMRAQIESLMAELSPEDLHTLQNDVLARDPNERRLPSMLRERFRDWVNDNYDAYEREGMMSPERQGETEREFLEEMIDDGQDEPLVLAMARAHLSGATLKEAGTKKYSLVGFRLHSENQYSGFPATHDSPVRHAGQFDWRAHAGGGAGAMLKGAGTYLSTSDQVHEYYKGMFTAKVEPAHNYMAADRINSQFHRAVGARTEVSDNAAKIAVDKGKEEAVAFVQRTLDEHLKDGPESTISQAEFDKWTERYEKLLGAIKAMPESEMRPKRIDGFRNDKAPTYEVSVNIADEQLLDWNKPAYAQSEAVERVMRDAGEEFDLPSDVLNRGEDFYRALSDHFAPGDRDTGDRQASDYLQAAGILGHRMKASAKDGVDRPNYVIYDDSKVTTNYVHFSRMNGYTSTIDEITIHGKVWDFGGGKAVEAERASFYDDAVPLKGKVYYEGFTQDGDQISGWADSLSAARAEMDRGGVKTNKPVRAQNRDGGFADSMLSRMRANPGNAQGPAPDQKAIEAELIKMLGPQIDVQWLNIMHAGEHERMGGGNAPIIEAIRLSVHSLNPLGPAYHESVHALFAKLTDLKQGQIMGVLEKAAQSAPVLNQLRTLLKDHPDALAQLSDPEERVAYMFQFWNMRDADGKRMLQVGEHTKNIFEKIADFIRSVLNIWSNDEHALHIMEYFQRGDFAKDLAKANPRDAVERSAMLPAQNKTINELKKMTEPFRNLGEALMVAGHQRLRDTGIPALRELADAMKLHGAGEGEDPGFVPAARAEHAQRMNAVATKLHGISEGALTAALESLQTKLNDPIAALATNEERQAARKAKAIFRDHLDAMFDYMRDAGVKVNDLGYGKDYFPHVYDPVYLSTHQQEFMEVLDRHSVSNSAKVLNKLMTADGNEFTVEVDKPGMQHIKPRVLAHIPDAELAPFMRKNVYEILSSYTQQAARRAEWARRFQDDGRGINALLHKAKLQGATDEQLATAQKFIRGVDGTLGDTINPEARRLMGNMIVYQNVRLLPLAIFSSVVDPMGVLVRGGTVGDAFSTFKRGMKELVKAFKEDPSSDEATQLAAAIGTIDHAMLAHTMSAAYTQGLAGNTARKINDWFFRYNFIEQFNTSMRVGATEAALKFLERHAFSPNKHSERYLAELGLTRKDVRIGPSGRVKVTVADGLTEAQATKMMAAVNRWVDGAVLRPDAVDQPIWMNDARFVLVAHLKRFTFSFHETIIKRVIHEYKNGNYQPAFALASYVPVMIAADLAKGLIQGGGDEPDWKANWGVADYIDHGIERAGLLGTGQFAADALQYGIGGLAGPTLEQLGSAFQVLGGKAEFAPMFLKSMPANALYAGFVDADSAPVTTRD